MSPNDRFVTLASLIYGEYRKSIYLSFSHLELYILAPVNPED